MTILHRTYWSGDQYRPVFISGCLRSHKQLLELNLENKNTACALTIRNSSGSSETAALFLAALFREPTAGFQKVNLKEWAQPRRPFRG